MLFSVPRDGNQGLENAIFRPWEHNGWHIQVTVMGEQNEGDTENIFIMLHTIICKLVTNVHSSIVLPKVKLNSSH